jgi:uncharacterized protein
MAPPAVVLASGHLIDAPGRTPPRFPPEEVPRVTAQVRQALEQWGVTADTTVITGGARGADLVVAEEALTRGARIVVCLALPQEEFEQRSVALPGSDWADRFRRLLNAAEVRHLTDQPGVTAGDDVFARTNRWMVEMATTLDPNPHAVVVWDGKQGDGPGGTRDLVHRLGVDRPDPRICVIDPTPRAYEERQAIGRPKRLLSIDGGGLRGALSLEILAAIEAGLRDRRSQPDLVLADYFDYVAGTSTGAIIAAALALGQPVDDIRRRYESLGHKVFAKRFLPMRLRSLYQDAPLRKELDDFFGPRRSLGDPELRTLLLVVMHNTVTDSPWPLSNCTLAKYNRADRNLISPPDRNLDIPLAPLVRASTAAPIYFEPQKLQVGRQEFLFQDGGVTPFNNPALLLFLMATLPEYGLRWPVGEDQLLLVSVGTGSAAAVHPRLRPGKATLAFNARNLPAVFMNGASVTQDLLCRSLGRCRAGRQIDREFGARLDATGVSGDNLFTYVRYDADLSDEALQNLGVTDPNQRQRVRKLDAVNEVPLLQQLGRHAATSVDLDRHFAGFLQP